MAQRTEKEETEFKVPETMTLCVNNCGVLGNPATNNMCQNCFNATTTTTAVAVGSGSQSSRSNPSRSPKKRSECSPPKTATFSRAVGVNPASGTEKKVVSRCSGCKKRVGLTGFRCRCGELFCADHRYSDRHDCSYDYKTAGREAIARENPVVKAAKIVKV
ncbi:Zinc finger A20 and AN1 domain-containing stress-associated protein 1 [Hibiscus syriacus]|uniref:Zinc finger A20 and AN1 domain-containing stress-associated protein 1 n=1 Tax=Hibiscus syriacus TaxID=106335 RepID=A0A6A3BXW6_HIBSY|nr:zinc finger A20 and AN1 domain-containing stress-associated protein 5-like [Hibiscus syriacus]KAE8720787.1 Zinc finger A20 and AN1 domain-containing stress-associated protein 1 [Hibiscus syriacus]